MTSALTHGLFASKNTPQSFFFQPPETDAREENIFPNYHSYQSRSGLLMTLSLSSDTHTTKDWNEKEMEKRENIIRTQ